MVEKRFGTIAGAVECLASQGKLDLRPLTFERELLLDIPKTDGLKSAADETALTDSALGGGASKDAFAPGRSYPQTAQAPAKAQARGYVLILTFLIIIVASVAYILAFRLFGDGLTENTQSRGEASGSGKALQHLDRPVAERRPADTTAEESRLPYNLNVPAVAALALPTQLDHRVSELASNDNSEASYVAFEAAMQQHVEHTGTAMPKPFLFGNEARKKDARMDERGLGLSASVEGKTSPDLEQRLSDATSERTDHHHDLLLSRSMRLIRQGKLGAARLILERAAQAGDTRALLTLAQTYDKQVLTEWNADGTQANGVIAQELYQLSRARSNAEKGVEHRATEKPIR